MRNHVRIQQALGIAIALIGCVDAGPGPVIENDVEALVEHEGALARTAEERLVARGRASILYLETGLYGPDEAARRRIVRTLAQIDDPEAECVLDHVRKYDASEVVREAAGPSTAACPWATGSAASP